MAPNINGWFKLARQEGYEEYMASRGYPGTKCNSYELMFDDSDPKVFHHVSIYNGVKNEYKLPLDEAVDTGFIWKEGEKPEYFKTKAMRPMLNEYVWDYINSKEFYTYTWQSDDKMTVTGLDKKSLVTFKYYFERIPGPTEKK